MVGRIPKIVVFGSTYVDMAIKCSQFPQSGQVVAGSGFSCTPTGPGINQVVEATICGCETYLLSKVGDDSFGEMVKENLQTHGVNTDFVSIAHAMNTGIIVTMVNSQGENSSCVSAGANRALNADEIASARIEQLIGSADVCLINSDLSADVISTAIRLANLYKTKVILEVPVTHQDCEKPAELDWPMEYYSVDILLPDFDKFDVAVELGAGNTHKAKFLGSELVARGVGCVIIKMGAKGAFVIDRQGTVHVPGFKVELVDHTCCGDAFAGALAASCGTGDKPRDAVHFAAAAGALACTKFGSQDALPTKQEIIQLLQNQPD